MLNDNNKTGEISVLCFMRILLKIQIKIYELIRT